MNKLLHLKPLLLRLGFVALSTAVFVFFSEKVYWYPQGYAIGELLLFYAFPTYACLWAVDYFQVRRLPGLLLVAALFAFLVEGVLTPVIYEAGLLDPIMPAYFVGWHGLLAVVFGWYLLRKWLVNGQWKRLLVGSLLFGLFWGLWAIVYWLPENFEGFANPGQWAVVDFGLHAFTFTLLLMGAHWLLGRGGWQAQFMLSRAEKWIATAVLVFLFVTLAFPAAPLGIFKLLFLLTLVLLPLTIHHRRQQETGSIFSDLDGFVSGRYVWSLFAMPITATMVYALVTFIQPSEVAIRDIFELLPLLQLLLGGVLFLWAVVMTIRPFPILQRFHIFKP